MSWLMEIVKFLGLGYNTYVEKFDLGDGYKKKRCRETDQFLKFRDRGTEYIILKSVAPKIDDRGNKYYYMYESDVHTFDMKTGQVLDKRMEKDFKDRLTKNEIDKFQLMVNEVQKKAMEEKVTEIYNNLAVQNAQDEKGEKDEKGKDISDMFNYTVKMPSIAIGKAVKSKIDNLTPHDTINEVFKLLLDGEVLANLLKKAKVSFWLALGILTVGVSIGWILIILFAVGFPNEWSALVGKPLTNMVVNTVRRLLHC